MNHVARLLCAVFLFAGISYASVVPNLCYDTVDGTQFCTLDKLGNVQVFIYNAGWCPPCNEEMHALAPAYSEFANSPVTFASLSGEGYAHGSKPDQTFLKSWKQKHNIPFVVAGKYKDFGQSMGASGTIPFAVIVNQKGESVAHGNLSPSTITSTVRKLLKDAPPVETVETVDAKSFLEGLKGDYQVELVNGELPHASSDKASIYYEEEFPDLEILYMPYCTDNGCMDSGGFFAYTNTQVSKTEKGYQIALTENGKCKLYDWEEIAEGKIVFRNHQFVLNEKTVVLEHVLHKIVNVVPVPTP